MNTCSPKTTRRTRTPADLKYLLNDRAAAAGALARTQAESEPLRARLAELEAEMSQVAAELAPFLSTEAAQRRDLEALDLVIEHLYPGADPEHAGTVDARSGRCGRRGGLKEFLFAALTDASPGGLTASGLCELAAAQFELALDTVEARVKFKDVVKRQLRRWRAEGLIEAYPGRQIRTVEWRRVAAAAGHALLALVEASRESATYSPGGEVGRQRAGRHRG